MSDLINRWQKIRASMESSGTVDFYAVRKQIDETIDEIERLQRKNKDYLRMLKMSGQNIGLRLLDAEEKIARLEAMLDRLADPTGLATQHHMDKANGNIHVADLVARCEYAASHRRKDDD